MILTSLLGRGLRRRNAGAFALCKATRAKTKIREASRDLLGKRGWAHSPVLGLYKDKETVS